jgi:hypothetical protein
LCPSNIETPSGIARSMAIHAKHWREQDMALR